MASYGSSSPRRTARRARRTAASGASSTPTCPTFPHMLVRHADGCENATELWRELRTHGYSGTVNPRKGGAPLAAGPPAAARPHDAALVPRRAARGTDISHKPCGVVAAIPAPVTTPTGVAAHPTTRRDPRAGRLDHRVPRPGSRGPYRRHSRRALRIVGRTSWCWMPGRPPRLRRMARGGAHLRHRGGRDVCARCGARRRGGARRPHHPVEQWADGRPHHEAENAEASDVRSRKPRSPAASFAARRVINTTCGRACNPGAVHLVREVVRHIASRRACLRFPAGGVEQLTRIVLPLRRVLAPERRLRREEVPLLAAHITQAWLSFHRVALHLHLHARALRSPADTDSYQLLTTHHLLPRGKRHTSCT